MKKNTKDKIILYKNKNGNIELRADTDGDTLWATQAQISGLFEVNIPTINEHLKNIFKTKELKQTSTIRKFRIVQNESGRKVERGINFYNLDTILAVGYRVNSKKATKFRIWATSILRDYLIKGFNLNHRRLVGSSEKVDGLDEAIEFLKFKLPGGHLKTKVSMRLTKDVTP